MSLSTFKDLTSRLLDFIDGSGEKDVRDVRRAAHEALREVADAFSWGYYVAHGRLNVFAPYTTGTIAYDAGTRVLTLTGGVWPSWAADASVEIADLRSEVESRDSDAELTLAENTAPGSDVAAGTAYSLSRDSYPVPSDFYKPITSLEQANCGVGPQFVEPQRLGECRPCGLGFPGYYSIVGSPDYQGAHAFRFSPPPTQDVSYDYFYRRTPRVLSIEAESTGTVAVAADSAVVTGTDTAFSQKHVGCVLRIASDANPPTDYAGDNVFDTERVVLSVASATSLTVDGAYSASVSGKGFLLSDPIDVAPYMTDYLYVSAARRLAIIRNRLPGLNELTKERDDAKLRSQAADRKSAGRRFAGRWMDDYLIL